MDMEIVHSIRGFTGQARGIEIFDVVGVGVEQVQDLARKCEAADPIAQQKIGERRGGAI